VKNAFRDGAIRTTGTDIDKILPAMSRFGGVNRQEKKKAVIEELKVFFEKYFGVYTSTTTITPTTASFTSNT
jgi:type I restriction enzyme R subunit